MSSGPNAYFICFFKIQFLMFIVSHGVILTPPLLNTVQNYIFCLRFYGN